MPDSFPLLFRLLILLPGVLIPLYVSYRLLAVFKDERRSAGERAFAGGAILSMLLVIAFAVYASEAVWRSLSALAERGV